MNRCDSDRSTASTSSLSNLTAVSSYGTLTSMDEEHGCCTLMEDEDESHPSAATDDGTACGTETHEATHHQHHPEGEGKHVRFSTASMRVYPQVLGDHPYCSVGCPLELGWTYDREEVVSCSTLSVEQQSSSSSWCYKLTAEERLAILQSQPLTYSEREVRKACRRRLCCGEFTQGRQGRKLQREFFGSNNCNSSSTPKVEE